MRLFVLSEYHALELKCLVTNTINVANGIRVCILDTQYVLVLKFVVANTINA